MAGQGFSASNVQFPAWQWEYEAVFLERDSQKLFAKLQAAEAAIFNRLQALSSRPNQQAERQAIENALGKLRVVMREKLNFPDWEAH